jgi:hypothetical protein
MNAESEQKGTWMRRFGAVLVVFLVSGPACFMLWAYFSNGNKTLASNLAVPIAATAFCSLAMLFMPERVVNAVSNLLGWFGLVF